MPQFTVDLEVLREALLHRSLSQVGESLLRTSVTSPFRVTDFVVAPSASLAVRVLNRPEDRDDDAVFGQNDVAHIPFALQSAWVKYKVRAQAEGRIALADHGGGGSGEIALSDYRVHSATDSAWSAVTGDLSSPRTLLELDDVRKLKPGEALAMEVGGALTASVEFPWSDVLAAKLPEILDGLSPVTVRLRSGLTTSAAVRVTDQFSIVISRTREGRFRFAVKKAAATSNKFDIEVSAGADVSGTRGVDDVLDAVFADAPDVLDPVRAQVRKRLVAAARWKASTGFAYEYARIDEKESVADYILLDDTRLAEDHATVLAGDFTKITDALRGDTGARRLVRFLNDSTLVRRSSFGFTLGLGKWALKTQDSSTFRKTTRTSLDGAFKLITCSGARKYDETNVPGNDFEWTVDLKAQMNEFLAAPTTLDFEYGLHLLLTLERAAIGMEDLERMTDLAAMWDVCVPQLGDFADAIGRKGSLRVQLLFDHDALARAVAHAGDAASWAAPLAMAMPFMSAFPERRTFAARRSTYTNVWQQWLHTGETAEIRVNSGLTLFERQGGPGSFAWCAGPGHPQLRRRLDAFLSGVRQLHAAMTNPQAPSKIGETYDALQQFWSQRLYVAAAGRWLLDRSAGNAKATLQIEFADTSVTV